MTNFEKYYDEIKECEKKNGSYIQSIINLYCNHNNVASCFDETAISWLFEEHKIKVKEETIQFLKFIKKEYKYIAKDKEGKVYIYEKKPIKCCFEWFSPSGKINCISEMFDNNLFDFLSFDDEEPCLISDIINNNKKFTVNIKNEK